MGFKDAITKAAAPRVVTSEIEVNGDKVELRFRALKYPERKAIFQSKFKEVGKDKDGKPLMQIPSSLVGDLNAEFLATTLVDEEGSNMFTKDEILKDWDSVTADSIANAGMKALGMADEKPKAEEENPSTPNQESGTP